MPNGLPERTLRHSIAQRRGVTIGSWIATTSACAGSPPATPPSLERFYAELSANSRALRFLGACRGIGPEQADEFAAADHQRRDGFVAVEGGRIVGHLVLEPLGGGTEEVAVAVDDRAQHHGVGTLLLAAGVASARLRGVRCLVAWVRADNGAMRNLLTRSRHPLRLTWEGLIARYELAVPPAVHRGVAA